MNVLTRRVVTTSKKLIVPSSSSSSTRTFVNVGDKIPVNFVKDGKDPLILADKDYPDWVHTLADKLPTKNQLIQVTHVQSNLIITTFSINPHPNLSLTTDYHTNVDGRRRGWR